MRALVAVWMVVLTLSGCASAPSEADLRSADYGTPIAQDEAERQAVSYLETRLLDAASAQYKWASIERGWARDAIISGGGVYYGYLLVGQINAKNSYGGYVGFRRYQFIFQNGKLRQAWAEEPAGYGTVMSPL